MTVRVYQLGALAPLDLSLVRAQMRAAHDYRNELISIERGRRAALREIDATPEVRAAEGAVTLAPAKERPAAIRALREARKAARDARAEDLAQITLREGEIRRAARELTCCYWGTYLDIEAAHNQARAAPLYGDDAVTPNDPAPIPWQRREGQIGVQLQGGLRTSEALAGTDTRVRLVLAPNRNASGRDYPRYGTLWLRAGSEGRDPIWARVPVKVDRAIPDAAHWKWVRLSERFVGPTARWTVEITLDDGAAHPHSLDASLTGAVAVEWAWEALEDGALRTGRWANTDGESDEILLPARVAMGIHKSDGIRSVRDRNLEPLLAELGPLLAGSRDALPHWLARALARIENERERVRAGYLHYLVSHWRESAWDGAREAYDCLQAWELRDRHLWEYEANARQNALRWRKDLYRKLAANWARRYRTVLLSDQDLSREARWGEESDRRFTAGCSELRLALEQAFGAEGVVLAKWKDAPDERDTRRWCERTRDAWMDVGARDGERFAKRKEKTSNAWAARKAKKRPGKAA